MNEIMLEMDGIPVTCLEGETLLQAARAAGISIPSLCYHDYCTANGLCRICVVEVENVRTLVPACVGKAAQGMKVLTSSPRVVRARRVLLEMLASSVDLSDAPEVLEMMEFYGVNTERFPGATRRYTPILDDNPMYIRDYAKCILCWRCVQVCAADAQYTHAINFSGRGFHTQISTAYGLELPLSTCVFCGQCIGVCPSGALKPRRKWLWESQGKE